MEEIEQVTRRGKRREGKEMNRTSSSPSKLQKSSPLTPTKHKKYTHQPLLTHERDQDGTAMSNLTQASLWFISSTRPRLL